MPTRGDIEAATPRCRARRQQIGEARNFGLRGGMTQWMSEFFCLQPMRYRAADDIWLCQCGATQTGASLGARATGFAIEAEAA